MRLAGAEQQAAKPISKGMSQVSSKDATAVLDVLNFQETDGDQVDDDAIKKPSGTVMPTLGAVLL